MRAGLGCYPVILVGGWIATQYWHDRFFSWAVPALVGLACAAAAVTASGAVREGVLCAVPAAVLAVAFSYSLVPGGAGLVTPPGQTLPPYLAAAAGALAWPALFGGARSPTDDRSVSAAAPRR